MSPRIEYVPLRTQDDEETVGDEQGYVPHERQRRLRPRAQRRVLMCVVVVAIFIAAIGLVHSRGSDISPAPEPTEDVQDVPEPVAPEPVIPQFDNPYFHTGNVDEHNRAVIARLERCEALGLLAAMADPSTPLRSTEAEAEASAAGCGRNETTVILLASYWFRGAMAGNKPTGEIVYAQSTVSALNASGYALLFSSLGWMNHDMRRTTEWYRRWKDNVRLVLADAEQVGVCFDATQEGQKCVKTRENEGGIPAWKLLAWYYWDEPGTPLGPEFTLSPTATNNNYHLSYSIEPTCKRLPYVPHEERIQPPQAYLLGKQAHYLGPQKSETFGRFVWTLPAFADMHNKLNVSFVGGFNNDEKETLRAALSAGITNFGQLGKFEFYAKLAQSFVLVGVGQPRISPSPWDALCQGVPFINPILKWDAEHPEDKTKWRLQQWHMIDLEPPYVYAVYADDLDGLGAAVLGALDNPINSFIPEKMTFEWVKNRMAEVVEDDWRSRGEKVFAQGQPARFDADTVGYHVSTLFEWVM